MPALETSTHATQHCPDAQVLGQFIPLLYHYNMLQDEDRVGAFRDAINFLVQPGMHVLELGGGTGILSSFAARRGASVTCVERNPELVECARRLIERNGLDEQIEVIEADAATFRPSRPVDVVVCEMLHVGLLREKQAQVISEFKRTYQKAFGQELPIFIPEVSILMVQPVQQDFEFAGYQAPIPLFQAPLADQPRTHPIASLVPYETVTYQDAFADGLSSHEVFVAERAGTVNAIRLVTQNVLAIDEPGQRAITWANQCLVLPIDSEFEVAAGQGIGIEFQYRAGASIDRLSSSLRVLPADIQRKRAA